MFTEIITGKYYIFPTVFSYYFFFFVKYSCYRIQTLRETGILDFWIKSSMASLSLYYIQLIVKKKLDFTFMIFFFLISPVLIIACWKNEKRKAHRIEVNLRGSI